MTTHVKPPHLESSAPAGTVPEPRNSKLITRIGRTYRFESAHHLPLLPDGHKCKNVHGHNYRVEVVISGALDARGFVMDFAEIDAEILPLIRKVDHRLLNDVEGLENPTAEIIATWFLQRITGCESVRVYENDDCWAEVKIA
ncbi:6-carboxytetrahydropterin synthase QueD [Bradyrhizobium brasilense]|uniref:6-carboxytetrahydropterin synthase QueD n=1 Tax=Bradyrhizobium brasilense TaxID=1419277 RepID=UPI001E2FB2AD|nr:6-carboxytetrahydropterin synthase QueD [Bradyrhizobium brasilense]MCC8970045.1 6-carboxytetrahydropterin synthase QueD [Bradyrhizobium brasilense]